MKLNELWESVELQGFIYIRVFDVCNFKYIETIETVDCRYICNGKTQNIAEKYGDYPISHIYPHEDGVAVEIYVEGDQER